MDVSHKKAQKGIWKYHAAHGCLQQRPVELFVSSVPLCALQGAKERLRSRAIRHAA